MLVTVLTPAYNRSNQLRNLYNSLIKQSNKDFEWLVVDDGSKDDTEAVINSFIKENEIAISYIKKENGGKHTALNIGIKKSNGELIFIVDSDDILTSDAIESISLMHQKYKNNTRICGFSFLREFPDGRINGNEFSQNELIDTFINVRINSNDMYSDKAEIYYTKCLKEFPFPEFANEHFLGEDVVWVEMSRKYKMVHINEPIYIGEYQTDGLTKNRRINNIRSPRGCTLRANLYLKNDINIKFREKCALQYLIYGWFAKKNTASLIRECNQPLLAIINLLPARLIYLKWRKLIKEN